MNCYLWPFQWALPASPPSSQVACQHCCMLVILYKARLLMSSPVTIHPSGKNSRCHLPLQSCHSCLEFKSRSRFCSYGSQPFAFHVKLFLTLWLNLTHWWALLGGSSSAETPIQWTTRVRSIRSRSLSSARDISSSKTCKYLDVDVERNERKKQIKGSQTNPYHGFCVQVLALKR